MSGPNQNSKVLANLEKRRDAEAKLMANEISPDEFLVAMSFQNSSQPFVLCARNRRHNFIFLPMKSFSLLTKPF